MQSIHPGICNTASVWHAPWFSLFGVRPFTGRRPHRTGPDEGRSGRAGGLAQGRGAPLVSRGGSCILRLVWSYCVMMYDA